MSTRVGRLGVWALLAPLVFVLAGCEQNNAPTAPTDRVQLRFDGTMVVGDRLTFTFPVGTSGVVTVQLQNISGVDTSIQATVGLAVGTWDGTACTHQVENNAAIFSTVIAGTALAGNYCVRLYDVGQMTEDVNYAIQVEHP